MGPGAAWPGRVSPPGTQQARRISFACGIRPNSRAGLTGQRESGLESQVAQPSWAGAGNWRPDLRSSCDPSYQPAEQLTDKSVLSQVPVGPRVVCLLTETQASAASGAEEPTLLALQAPALGGLCRAHSNQHPWPTPHPALWFRRALPGCKKQGDARRTKTFPGKDFHFLLLKAAEGSEVGAWGGP